MSEAPRRFNPRTLAIGVVLLCVGFAVVAAFPDAALALIYFLLYPLGIFVMVSLIVGVLVLGRFLIERMRG